MRGRGAGEGEGSRVHGHVPDLSCTDSDNACVREGVELGRWREGKGRRGGGGGDTTESESEFICAGKFIQSISVRGAQIKQD